MAAAAGATGIRVPNRNSFRVGDRVVFEPGTANEEVRFVASIVNPNPESPAPNVFLTEPLAFVHAAGSAVASETVQTGVGFQPDYATEGKHEALEFAAGNYGLLESALDYAQDVQPPQVQMTGPYESRDADRHHVRVHQRAFGDPLHDRRIAADEALADVGLDRSA